MAASNLIPHSSQPSASGDVAPGRGGDDRRPTPISDDDAARLIAGAPAAADPFAILIRRGGRPMTDEQIAEFLCQGGGPIRDIPPSLPTARVAAIPAAPAPVLGYAHRTDHDACFSDPRYLAELPITFRVLRVAPWLLLAAFLLYAMVWRISGG